MNDSDLMCQCPICGKSDKHFTIISPPKGQLVWNSVGGVVMAKCPCGASLMRKYSNGFVLHFTKWEVANKTCHSCKNKENFFAKYCTQCGAKFDQTSSILNPIIMGL